MWCNRCENRNCTWCEIVKLINFVSQVLSSPCLWPGWGEFVASPEGPEEEYWHYECVGHRWRRSRAASETETNIFWTRFSYAAGEIPTHPPSWTHLRKSTSGKTKEEVDRQRPGGLQPTGVDAHWSRQSCTGSTSMAEHCTQLGLPAHEDYIFVAKALSQVKSLAW